MQVGKIFISDYIGTFNNDDGSLYNGVQLVDVVSQVRALNDVDAYEVVITSGGGAVDVGFDIYHYLKSLKKPITTVAKGVCASIATVIFMSGNKRTIMPNCEFMVHNPSGGVQGNADDIESYFKDIKKIENEIIDFYAKALGTTKEAIAPILRDETFLTTEQAVNIGFATDIGVELGVVAKFNTKTEIMSELSKESKNWIQEQLSSFAMKFSKEQKVTNKMVTDANGVMIDFPDVAEDAEPQIGDVATMEGQPVNGEHVMPDGRTFVFTDGALTEIVEAEQDEELEAVKKERDELKEQLAQANKDAETAKSEETKMAEELDAIFKEFTNLKKSITSKFEIDLEGKTKKEDAKVKEKSTVQMRLERLNEIKNKR
jgi:ATP-dependent Clp protease, protease subunit